MGMISRKISAVRDYVEGSLKRKINVWVVGTAALILILLIGVLTTRTRKIILEDSKKVAIEAAQEQAYQVANFVNVRLSSLKTLAMCADNQLSSAAKGDSVLNNILTQQRLSDSNIMAVWYMKDAADSGRLANRFIEYPKGSNDTDAKVRLLNEAERLAGASSYSDGSVVISNPFKLDEKWAICISYPIRHNEAVVGAIGYIVSNDYFIDKATTEVAGLKEFRKIITDTGVLLAHTEAKKIGKPFSEGEQTSEIFGYIEKGEMYECATISTTFNANAYKVYAPIKFEGTNTVWSFCRAVPVTVMVHDATILRIYAFSLMLLGLIILVLVINFLSKSISRPIIEVSNELNILAEGRVEKVKEIKTNSRDEIGEMITALNSLKSNLSNISSFVKNIGAGMLDSHIEVKNEDDIINHSLIEMQKNLVDSKNAEVERRKQDEMQNWIIKGCMEVDSKIRANSGSVKSLCETTLHTIISYTKLQQGGIYLIDKDEDTVNGVDLIACFAFSRKKFMEKHMSIEEGLIGRCIYEKAPIIMSEVPADYLTISSGLGDRKPACLVLLPLISNEEVLGVIEVASFSVIADFEIEFLKKAVDSLSAAVLSVEVNERTQNLLDKTKSYAEEMGAQEEELRQNMEEMQASKEEMERKTEEYENTIRDLREQLDRYASNVKVEEN